MKKAIFTFAVACLAVFAMASSALAGSQSGGTSSDGGSTAKLCRGIIKSCGAGDQSACEKLVKTDTCDAEAADQDEDGKDDSEEATPPPANEPNSCWDPPYGRH